jgi:hypothetical protein
MFRVAASRWVQQLELHPPQRARLGCELEGNLIAVSSAEGAEGEAALGATGHVSAHGRTQLWPCGAHLEPARAKREHTI